MTYNTQAAGVPLGQHHLRRYLFLGVLLLLSPFAFFFIYFADN